MGAPVQQFGRLGPLAAGIALLAGCWSVTDSAPLARQLSAQFKQQISVSFDSRRKGLVLMLPAPPDSVAPDDPAAAAEQMAIFARTHYAHPFLVQAVTVIVEPAPPPAGDSAGDGARVGPAVYNWTAAQLAADGTPTPLSARQARRIAARHGD